MFFTDDVEFRIQHKVRALWREYLKTSEFQHSLELQNRSVYQNPLPNRTQLTAP